MVEFDLSKITGREPPLETDEDRENELAALRERVAWFEEQADALRRYMEAKPPQTQAVLAVVVAMSIDSVKREALKASASAGTTHHDPNCDTLDPIIRTKPCNCQRPSAGTTP
jgi:hypothetical protein